MSLTAERTLKLMAFADGELDGKDLAEVEGWLATDEDAARFVHDVAHLGDVLGRGYRMNTGDAVASFDVADAVLAATAREPATSRSSARDVVSLASRRRSHRLTVIGVAGTATAALALAASVFLYTRPREEAPLAGAGRYPGSLSTITAPASVGTGIDVNLHESAGQSVGVFYNETNVKTTSVIVWVDETGAK